MSGVGSLRAVLLCAAALTLTACSNPADDKAAPAQASAPSANADAAGAEAFVRGLYEDGGTTTEATPRIEDSAIWSARTRALIAETDRLTLEGYEGFFEAEPICDCQDGTPVLRSATATITSPTTADVVVVQSFAEAGNANHNKTYKLVREGGAWRLDDMTYQDMGDAFEREPLVQQLNTWIAEAKAAPAADEGE